MIKRALFIGLMWACFAMGAFAQSTVVSGTITDSSLQVWFGGSYQFTFYPAPSNPSGAYFWNGAPFNTSQVFKGALNSSGAFSVSIPANSSITPSGSQWSVQVCSAASANCYTTTLTITGATMNISSLVVPPPITVNAAGISQLSAYQDSQITNASLGTTYFNLTTGTVRLCTVQIPCTWVPIAGGEGGAVVASQQYQLFYQPNSGTSATAKGSNVTTDATFDNLFVPGNALTAGPTPRIDAQSPAYGARAVQTNPNTTCSTTGSGPPYATLNCASAAGLQIGDGAAVLESYSVSQTTPAAPTVTSPAIIGSSTYCYKLVGVDNYNNQTPASSAGCVTNAPAVFGNLALPVSVTWSGGTATGTTTGTFDANFASYTTNTKHVSIVGSSDSSLNGYWLIASEPSATTFTFTLAGSGVTGTGGTARAVNTFIVTGCSRLGTTLTCNTDIPSNIIPGTFPKSTEIILTGMTPLDMNGYHYLDSTLGDSVSGTTITIHNEAWSATETSTINGYLSVYEYALITGPNLASPTIKYNVYGNSTPIGSYDLLGQTLYGQSTFKDAGFWLAFENGTIGPSFGPDTPQYPTPPPTSAILGRWATTITNISGNTLTVDPGVPTAVTSVPVYHDDAEAVNAALAVLPSNGYGHAVVLSPPITYVGGGTGCEFCQYHFWTPVFVNYGNTLSVGASLSVWSTIIGGFQGANFINDPYSAGNMATQFSSRSYIPINGGANPLIVFQGQTNTIHGLGFGDVGPDAVAYPGQTYVEYAGTQGNQAAFGSISDSAFVCGDASTATPLVFVGNVGFQNIENTTFTCSVPFNAGSVAGQINQAPSWLSSVLMEASDQTGISGGMGQIALKGQTGMAGKGFLLDESSNTAGGSYNFVFSGPDSFADDQQPVTPFLTVNGTAGDEPQLLTLSGVIMDSTNAPVVANASRGYDWTIQNTQTSGYASTINGKVIGGLTAINNLQSEAGLGQDYDLNIFIPGTNGVNGIQTSALTVLGCAGGTYAKADGTGCAIPATGGINPPVGDIGGTTGSPTVTGLEGLALPTLGGSTGYLYDSAGTLSLSTGANAGVFTNTQMNQPFQFKIGNPNFTNGGMFATYLSDALVGETLVPAGATVPQADGITSACQSATASVNCVAAYGVGRAGANSQAVWGNNYVAADTDASGVTHTSDAIIGNEIDIGCTSTTTSCHGLDIHPVLTAGPTVGWGVHLFGDKNNGFQLPFAFLSDNGVATVGLQLGALGTTASQSSQPLNFVSILSSSATSTSSIQSDALGGLGVTPSNGILSVSNGIGEVSAGGYLPNGVLVSSLPSAAANPGLIKSVTDSTAISAEGQTCVGSSTTKALAFSNGTIWKCF